MRYESDINSFLMMPLSLSRTCEIVSDGFIVQETAENTLISYSHNISGQSVAENFLNFTEHAVILHSGCPLNILLRR